MSDIIYYLCSIETDCLKLILETHLIRLSIQRNGIKTNFNDKQKIFYAYSYVFLLLQVRRIKTLQEAFKSDQVIITIPLAGRHFHLHQPSHYISRMRSLPLRITEPYVSLSLLLSPSFSEEIKRPRMPYRSPRDTYYD